MTAEEKLLKLIRKKDQPKTKAQENSKTDIKAPAGDPKKLNLEIKGLDTVVFFNQFLILVLIILAGYLAVKFFSADKEQKINIISEKKTPTASKEQAAAVRPEIKSFSYFETKIGSRNIFFNPWEKQQQGTEPSADAGVDLGRQIKLVGIVLDKDPKAIIEDLKGNQTLFLSPGGSINNAVLKEIRGDKVIFLYNNQEVELK